MSRWARDTNMMDYLAVIEFKVRLVNEAQDNAKRRAEAREQARQAELFINHPFYLESATPIVTSSQEWVNGYQLLPTSENILNVLDLPDFRKFSQLLTLPRQSEEWFKEQFERGGNKRHGVCSDWNKMDEHGESYGGYWKYPKGTYEKENAYSLSRTRNIHCCAQLPFSGASIMETIWFACPIRRESVRFSNFLLIWVQRKQQAMQQLKDYILSSLIVRFPEAVILYISDYLSKENLIPIRGVAPTPPLRISGRKRWSKKWRMKWKREDRQNQQTKPTARND